MDETERIERRLKLHDLRVLMSVVEQGSMAKAAESLATSQPAVSRTIADLEHSLSVRLLDRGPRGIVPTPYGRALIKRSVTVFDELRLAHGGGSTDRGTNGLGRRIGSCRHRQAYPSTSARGLSRDG